MNRGSHPGESIFRRRLAAETDECLVLGVDPDAVGPCRREEGLGRATSGAQQFADVIGQFPIATLDSHQKHQLESRRAAIRVGVKCLAQAGLCIQGPAELQFDLTRHSSSGGRFGAITLNTLAVFECDQGLS